ncbi:hypothetical protein ABTX34_26405 [Streptomyces sp. NPDC096538]|uniref:hypothetical protein n=1 Tax=Streptomyces sp. NPDC096538 TaxID=3155427 RepID=UPI003318CE55
MPTEYGRTLSQSQALNGIAAALYDQEGWMLLRGGLAAAQNGDGTTLLLLADSYSQRVDDNGYANINSANTAVNCADYKDRFTVEDVHRNLPEFREVSPVFGEWLG